MTVPFHPRHLAEVELGAEEDTEYAQFGPDLFRVLADTQGPAQSLVDDAGRVLGCFGMHLIGREGVLWALFSDEVRGRAFGLHRAVKRHLDRIERLGMVQRMLAAVRAENHAGHRWITCLGFTYEGDIEISNLRYRRYVKCQQHQLSRSSAR